MLFDARKAKTKKPEMKISRYRETNIYFV